jgi:biotin operon repressor
MTDQSRGEVLLYSSADGSPAIEVRLEGDTVWLSQQQIAELFGTTRENVTMHLRNIYEEGELSEEATRKEFLQVRKEGSRRVSRRVSMYDLDAILSVGYRVKSATATRFRMWATQRLHDVLVQGYALNQRRLDQIGSVVRILERSTDELVAGTADVLASYLPGLELLRDYDDGSVTTHPTAVPGWTLALDEARSIIKGVGKEFPNDDLFGAERGGGLEAVIGAVYQSFAGADLYPTAEEKAANLLYLMVKDRPLSDGNKRNAAALSSPDFSSHLWEWIRISGLCLALLPLYREMRTI